MQDHFSISILGARGSVPVSGPDYLKYGGHTLSVLVRINDDVVLLDAGTGLLNFDISRSSGEQPIALLLSHSHIDHLLGLPLWPFLFDPSNRIRIYGKSRDGLTVEEQVGRFLSPPLWPVGVDVLPASIEFFALPDVLELKDVTVHAMEGCHAGGVSIFRIIHHGKSVVYMTDCTIESPIKKELLAFADHCDLLLCDGQYAPEEWEAHADFGHNTWQQAAEFGKACGAKTVRVLHHDPTHTDALLSHAEMQLSSAYPNCQFAFEGEEIVL